MSFRELRLSRVARIKLGKMLQTEPASGADIEADYLRAAHVQPNGLILDLGDDQRMWFGPKELLDHDLRADDVVIVEGGAGYGRSALIRTPRPGWGFQNSIVRVRPKPGIADGAFLDYVLQARLFDGSIPLVCSTATIPHFTAEKVAAFPVPVPPLSEQQAIADFLDRETAKIDALIEKQTALIARLRERRGWTVEQAVNPPGVVGDRLAVKRALARVDQGISPETANASEDAEVWVLKAGAPNRGVFREAESKPVPDEVLVPDGIELAPGDLVVSRASGSPDLVASAAMVTELSRRLILSDKTFRFVPGPKHVTRYLYWCLNSRGFREQVRLATSGADGLANNIPLTSLRRLLVRLPTLAEQQAIADHLDQQTAKIDVLIAKAERFVEVSRERRSALITAAVTGQLDTPVRKAA